MKPSIWFCSTKCLNGVTVSVALYYFPMSYRWNRWTFCVQCFELSLHRSRSIKTAGPQLLPTAFNLLFLSSSLFVVLLNSGIFQRRVVSSDSRRSERAKEREEEKKEEKVWWNSLITSADFSCKCRGEGNTQTSGSAAHSIRETRGGNVLMSYRLPLLHSSTSTFPFLHSFIPSSFLQHSPFSAVHKTLALPDKVWTWHRLWLRASGWRRWVTG